MASVHVLMPAQRYVFAVSNGEAEATTIDDSAEGFRRYKSLQQEGRTAGMVAFPNTLLIRGERDYLVDPGLIMQGAPLIGAMEELGVDPNEVKGVILTHLHFDHAEGLAAWPMRRTYLHRLERDAPYAQIVLGQREMADLQILEGEEGEIEAGLRWMLTPGHSDGLISLLVDADDGLTVIASDCVGPLPEYFDDASPIHFLVDRKLFERTSEPLGLLVGVAVIALVGMLDDLIKLSPTVKLAGQIVAAAHGEIRTREPVELGA